MVENLHVEALNLRHLKAWVTVVEEGSVTAGARKLGISQPALSQQLKSLEQFFGSRLVERLQRGTRPTPFGRTLLPDANKTLATAERLMRQTRRAIDLEAGVLEIATLPTLVDAVMIAPIKRWQERHPKVSIRIKEFALQSSMVEAVVSGLGDLAIGVNPPKWPGTSISLGWEQFSVVLPQRDPKLNDTGPVDLPELSDHNWVLYSRSNGLADYVAAACAMSGFRPREAVRTSQVPVALQLVSAGLGAALVPSANIPPEMAGQTRTLNPPIAWELAAFARSELSRPAEEFVSLLQELEWQEKPANSIGLPGN